MSYVPERHEATQPYLALLKDVRVWLPSFVSDFEDAVQRLQKLVRTRGVGIVLVDLPKLGKLFDKSLSTGYFQHEKVPQTLGSWKKGTVIFQSLLTKAYEVDHWDTTQEGHPTLIFFLRTFLYLGKKLEVECPNDAVSQTVSEFFDCDSGLRRPHLNWSRDWLATRSISGLQFAPQSDNVSGEREQLEFTFGLESSGKNPPISLLSLLDRVSRRVVGQFPLLDPSTMVGRHGPGAVADVDTGEDKYAFPFWPKKLDQLFPYEQHAQHRYDLHLEYTKPYSTEEPPAKLLAVPKTFDKPRLITSEPTAHQFLQQGLMRWLRQNMPQLLRVTINLDSQLPSQEAALNASMDGEMSTVDLSSASDRLSLWTIERVFSCAPSILEAMHATRTIRVTNSTGAGPLKNSVVLRKYAGQGNATTFVVQSIVYAVVCMTAVIYDRFGPKAGLSAAKLNWAAQKCRVFGDDIVIPSSAGLWLTVLLEHLQLKVNWDKTHTRGHFRESCGMDAYKGNVVTPLYMHRLSLSPKPTPEELASWVAVSNNAHQEGLWSLASWMTSSIPDKVRWLLPISRLKLGSESDHVSHTGLSLRKGVLTSAFEQRLIHADSADGAGLRLHSYVNGTSSKRRRFNHELQREEVYALCVVNANVRAGRDTYDSLLQFFVEDPNPDVMFTSGWVVRNRLLFKRRWVAAQ